MARPVKKGLDYFPMDINFLKDLKVRKILRACGGSAPTILICLLGYIYGNEGYFMLWDEDARFLVADDVGTSEALVDEVIKKAIQVGFFDKEMFEQKKILTSRGIQARYKKAARQKTNNKICEELDLLSKNSPIDVVSNADNPVNHAENTQSKVKKSKVNKTKIKTSAVDLPIQKVSEYYQQNIGVIKPLVLEDMRMYLNDFQEQNTSSEEAVKIIELAIKTAVDNNKLSWSYANACLKNWTNENLFTLKDIETAREQRKADKQQTNGFSKKPYVEQMPDWDHKQAKPVDPQKLAELQKQWEQFKTKKESN